MPEQPDTPQEKPSRAPATRIRPDSALYRWAVPAALAVLTGALVTLVVIILAMLAELIPGL